jgi:hypothetical protein
MITIEYLPPSPRAGDISPETKEVALPLIACGLARRAPEKEQQRPATVNWRCETNAASGILWLIGVCARAGEKLQYSGDPAALKGAVFQHCCCAMPEPIPEKVVAEYTRQKEAL